MRSGNPEVKQHVATSTLEVVRTVARYAESLKDSRGLPVHQGNSADDDTHEEMMGSLR